MIARLTLRQLAANKLRLLATAFAVILGVAFLAGTLILTDTIRGTFDNVLAGADAGTDALVRASSPLALGYGQSARPIDAALLDAVRRVDGVDEAAVQVSGYAQILDHDGKAVGSVETGVLGMNWVTVPALNPFTLVAGRPPAGPAEVTIDKHSADTSGLHVGDATTVLSTGAPRPATIVGITRFGDVDTPGALAVVLFDDATAQAVLHQPGQIDAIAVTAAHGLSADALVARLEPVVGASNEVVSGAELTREHQDDIGDEISQFGTFLTVFALIALFVGAFIINNTFSIIVSQRTRDMALLRAVGATARQVRLAVLAEAAVTGMVASGLGLVAGIGVAKGLLLLMSSLGVDIPVGATVVTTATIVVTLLGGFTVTLVSAVLPARRASKVAPIAALREVASERSATSKRRVALGLLATAVAGLTVLLGLESADVKVVGAGAVALFLAVSALGPVIARPVASVLGAPVAAARGTAGSIARQNAMRNPRRTAKTASSLMIGVALVSLIMILAASIRTSGAGEFRSDFRGTAIVDSGAIDTSAGLSPTVAVDLASQPGVRTVAEQRDAAVEIDGEPAFLNAYDATAIGVLFDLGHVEGDLNALGSDGIAVAAGSGADAPQLGDSRSVTFLTGEATFTVRAIYDGAAAFLGDRFVDLAAFEANLPVTIDSRLYVDAADTAEVQRAVADYPTAKVLTTEAFITQQNGKLDQILGLVYALLALAVLIALLGIANTLTLSIHERRRELGLLRAVGMTRGQVRSAVRWEAVITALFATGLGLAIGAFLGWAIVGALAEDGIGRVDIPIVSLTTVTVIAAFAGIGAAVLPARRAARLDILGALATG